MINIPSTLRISFRALKVNKMRSALTMLGIIIGVGAVIAMLAVGTGASKRIAEQISSMGSNLLIILPGSTTPGMLTVRDWPLASGRPFTDQDVKSATKVCLLGQSVVDNLFGDMNPVGQVIRIKNVPFTVVGVLTAKGQSPHGQDQDDTILVPVATAQKKLVGTTFPGMVRIIMVKAKSTEDLSSAEKQVNELLRQRHRIGPKQENDFTVRNLTQFMQAQEQSTKVMTLLLGAIASVSLLVGGIGIMNIMLVSVTERTREIGIRMAIGAKKWDIRLQFIIEALTLSLIGGVAGILAGISGSKIISVLAGWSTVVP